MADRARSYLLVPAGGAGDGLGHLVRCAALARRLSRGVSFLTTHLDPSARRLLGEMVARQDARRRPALLDRIPPSGKWDLVVVDARKTGSPELDLLGRHGLVACLDEGGEARELAPFLVDTLPVLPHWPPANLSGPSYLFLPARRRFSPPAALDRVLVSLGGEDRERLAGKLVRAIVRQGVWRADQLTVLRGPLSGEEEWPPGVSVRSRFPRAFAGHDLLITHFGMTAFEAAATGIPVILFNPTSYHQSLGKQAGFPMIGVGTPNMRTLKRLKSDPVRLYSGVEKLHQAIGQGRAVRDRKGSRLDRALRLLSRVGGASCPLCGASGNRVIARFPDRTYRRCSRCSTVGLESFLGKRKRYDAAYFSSEYKAQYGRTYKEDFEAIRSASRPRAAIIRKLLGDGRHGVVLDVGCAYGPFLAAAADAGLESFGLDISADAAAYVRNKLGVPAIHASFESVPRRRLPRAICAVTMWYVIEHFPATGEVLARASSLLPPGGVLAFSTPNGRGVSARKDMIAFLRNSPGDHFAVLSPRGLRKVLSAHGLSLRRIRVTGHHPERFPGALGAAARRWPWATRALGALSVGLRLGDTFEAYAVKGSV